MSGIEKMELESKDLVAERIEMLKRLFPEIAVEGDGSIDFEKLRLILGDEVDEGQERYMFTWPGKADAIRQAQTPSTATLRPDEVDSVDWDTTENLYIEGDNLEVLKLLQRGYHGKVKMIYIDPPYNTGHDFVYKDSFQDSIENYKEQAGLGGQSNADTSGRYHSDWLSMMYPRLRLARELLSDDGVIFISIDDNEQKNLRNLCDEVFGEACFVGDIVWQKTYSPRNDAKGIPTEVEHIIAFSRNPEWTPDKLPRTEAMNASYESPDGDERLWASDNPAAPGAATHQGMVYGIQSPFTGEIIYPANGRCWTYEQPTVLEIMNEWCEYHLEDIDDTKKRAQVCGVSPESVRKGIQAIVLTQDLETSREQAEMVLSKGPWPKFYFTKNGYGGIRRKTYLDSLEGKLPTNFWPYSSVGHTDEAKKELKALFDGQAPFDTPKPTRLIKRMLDIVPGNDYIILDFFSGSATTAGAVVQKNVEDNGKRQFILVQLPESVTGTYHNLCEIGEGRIRKVGTKTKLDIENGNRQLKLGENPKPIPDIGFRVLKLDSSNFEKVNGGTLVDNLVKPGRTHDDIIFEMVLKWGLELSLPMEKTEILGYPVTSIADGELICCMDTGLTTEVLEAIAEAEPRRVFFLDSVLTDSLKLNASQIFRRVSERTGNVIELRTA